MKSWGNKVPRELSMDSFSMLSFHTQVTTRHISLQATHFFPSDSMTNPMKPKCSFTHPLRRPGWCSLPTKAREPCLRRQIGTTDFGQKLAVPGRLKIQTPSIRDRGPGRRMHSTSSPRNNKQANITSQFSTSGLPVFSSCHNIFSINIKSSNNPQVCWCRWIVTSLGTGSAAL